MVSNINTRAILTTVGLVQGLAFYLLTDQEWDHGARWVMAGATFALLAPLVFQLTYAVGSTVRATAASLISGAVMAGLWLWLDLRVQWTDAARDFDDHYMVFILSGGLATYILLPYMQTWLEEGRVRFPYPSLFKFSWNNILVAIIAGIFLGVFWLVLLLWWELFNLVGVDFFEDLFTDEIFAWAFSGAVLGLGVAIARENPRIVPTLRRVVLMLFQVLAPVLAVASILFLAFLPFTGLQPLWDTGAATGVLVALMFSLVLMVNAVIQDGEQEDAAGFLGSWVNRVMAVTMLALPIYAGLAFYATWLRIDQYGLTPERLVGKLIVIVAAIQVLTYAFGVVRYRTNWAAFACRANPVTALVVMGAALLLNTPLLDPYSRSASNQLARMMDGSVDVAVFDYGTLKFRLGQPGRDALNEIAELKDHPQQDVIDQNLLEAANATSYWDLRRGSDDRILAEADLVVRPKGSGLPKGLWEYLRSDYGYELDRCAEYDDRDCGILLIDIDRDGINEAVFLNSESSNTPRAAKWIESAMRWEDAGYMRASGESRRDKGDLWDAFLSGDYKLVEPAYFDIRIGEETLRY